MDTCILMAESLCCLPETITTLLSAIHQYKIQRKKVLEQVAIPYPMEPRHQTCVSCVSCIGRLVLYRQLGSPIMQYYSAIKKKKKE